MSQFSDLFNLKNQKILVMKSLNFLVLSSSHFSLLRGGGNGDAAGLRRLKYC